MDYERTDDGRIVMTREQVRGFDKWAIEQLGIPGVVLMENAGRGCAGVIAGRMGSAAGAKVCIMCGTGNNGGDGYVIARHLRNAGASVRVVITGDKAKVRGDARVNLDVWEALGGDVDVLDMGGDIAEQLRNSADGAEVVVDAIFGTGLSGQVRGDYVALIEAVNGLEMPIAAVDIPSGLDCDSGEPLGAAVRAAYTVTFVAIKKGFTHVASAAYTGPVFVASIGIEPGLDTVA